MGFLKNEILGFAVVLISDLQQCVRLQLPPKRTAPGNVNTVAYGKINTRLSPNYHVLYG